MDPCVVEEHLVFQFEISLLDNPNVGALGWHSECIQQLIFFDTAHLCSKQEVSPLGMKGHVPFLWLHFLHGGHHNGADH